MSEQKLWVRQNDIDKMVAALENFRGAEWWFQTENASFEMLKTVLSPLVLQNMKLQLEAGALELNLHKFKNVLETAIRYNLEARILQKRVAELEEQLSNSANSESRKCKGSKK